MKSVIAAALTLSLFAGTAALANGPHDRDHGRDDGRYSHERHHSHWDDRHHDRRDHDRYNHRDYDRHSYRNDHRYRSYERFRVKEYHRPYGYRARVWRRGDYLPPAYRTRVYVVHDYHSYRLRPPPRGHYWVRVDRDVVLAAVATGLILDTVYGLYY